MSPAGSVRPPGLFPQCTIQESFFLFSLIGLQYARVLHKCRGRLSKAFFFFFFTAVLDYAGERWLKEAVAVDTGTAAHTELANFCQYSVGKSPTQYFITAQYTSNIRWELHAIFERTTLHYIFSCLSFSIIVQIMTLCRRVHSEAEFAERN